METIVAGIVLTALACACLYGIYHEVKCMKANQRKHEEEMRFFRSFRKYLEDMEVYSNDKNS